MAEDQNTIKRKVRAFSNAAASAFPIKKVFLYGSWAKGTPHKDSDIDVGVVVDFEDHAQRMAITSKLFRYAYPIDSRIEPKCVFWDEYQHPEPCSILEEIIRTGIEVV